MGEAKIVQQRQCIVQVVVSKPIQCLNRIKHNILVQWVPMGIDTSKHLRTMGFYCTHAVCVISKVVYYRNSKPIYIQDTIM
jgi:hypothetical protein